MRFPVVVCTSLKETCPAVSDAARDSNLFALQKISLSKIETISDYLNTTLELVTELQIAGHSLSKAEHM